MYEEIKFIEYNGIKGYIELMKHDVEPLNNPECKSIELYYNGKDIKAVLDYIANLQEENKELGRYYTRANNEFLDLNKRIDKAIIYLNTLEKREAYKIEDDENGVPQIKVDNEEHLVYCLYNKLLNILQGEDNGNN